MNNARKNKMKAVIYIKDGNIQGVHYNNPDILVDLTIFSVDSLIEEGYDRDEINEMWEDLVKDCCYDIEV